MSRTQPETRIQRQIQESFTKDFGGKCIKVHGDAETERGTPDIIGSWNGRCVCVEVKVPGAEPEPVQVLRLNEWKAAGALVGCAHSVEEFCLILIGERVWDAKTLGPSSKIPRNSTTS